MLKVHISYKPPSYCSLLFRYRWRPRQFSRLKYFRTLVVPGRGFRKGAILQGRHIPSGLPVICQSCLIIKGYAMGTSAHATIHRNSTYVQTVRWSIYNTRQPEHPHLTICRYERPPQRPSSSTQQHVSDVTLRFDQMISYPYFHWMYIIP